MSIRLQPTDPTRRLLLLQVSAAPKLPPGLPAPDLILVNQIHGDHFSVPTLTAVAGDKAKLVAPSLVVAQLPPTLASRATAMTNGQSQEWQGISAPTVPSYNLTPARLNNHPKGRGNSYPASPSSSLLLVVITGGAGGGYLIKKFWLIHRVRSAHPPACLFASSA